MHGDAEPEIQRILSRSTVVALAIMWMASPSLAAQRAYVPQPLRVESCPAADSVLGPLGGDRGANVRGYYSTERAGTALRTGTVDLGSAGHFFTVDVEYPGRGPLDVRNARSSSAVSMMLQLYVRGGEARRLLETRPLPPIAITVDDSVPVRTGTPRVGTYTGPPQATTVPITFDLRYDDLLELIHARNVVVSVGDRRYRMSDRQKRDARGLLHVALCTRLE
jgi:hypothetical protein